MKKRSNLGKKLWKEETWIILYFDGIGESHTIDVRRPEIKWSYKNGHAAFLIEQSIPSPLCIHNDSIMNTISLESFGRFLKYKGFPKDYKIETRIIYDE